jgi:hypothetical protein
MRNTLDHRPLHRSGSSAPASRQERWSSDFLVDGKSLLKALDPGGGDFMGCFVRGFPAENRAKAAALLEGIPPDTGDGRILLYVCPECGDIGCGAYAVRVERNSGVVRWVDFAYVNGYEAPVPVQVPSFEFDEREYEDAVAAASAI